MDEIDLAQKHNELHLKKSLEAHRSQQVSGPSREICLECEEPIPEARQKASPGCSLCIDCQKELEAAA